MKYLKRLQDILESEISDYVEESQYEILFDDSFGDTEQYTVEFSKDAPSAFNSLTIRLTNEGQSVHLCEDFYRPFETFDFTVKEFYIALLWK